MRQKISLLAATALTIVTAFPALAAGLEARLNATRVAEGDQVVLSLSMDRSQGNGSPDLSVLSQDFNVLGTSSGTQTSIINGARSDKRTWQITLQPKRDGTLTIPAIPAGAASSAPLTLQVVDAADLPPAVQAARPSITVNIGAGPIYAHQEVPLTLRLRLPEGTRGADITPPVSSQVLLDQSGEDRVVRQSDGSAILERTYLLRPQTEGEIALDGFTATIEVSDPSASGPFADFGRAPFGSSAFDRFFGGNSPFGRSPFGSIMSPTRRLSATSDPITLSVAATPGGASGWALPAMGVELRQLWQPDPPEFRVGEAVTRKIQVVALGAHAEQIPDLTMPDVPGARIYFEGSDKRSIPTEKGTAAIREFTFSIVPTSGGDVTLPEVAIDWFNTSTDQAARAVLPAQTVHVEGPVMPAQALQSRAPADNAAAPPPSSRSDLWTGIALASGAALALALIVFALRRPDRSRQAAPAPKPAVTSHRQRQSALHRASVAARSGDRPGVHRAALEWSRAAQLSPDRMTVRFPELGRAFAALERELFGDNPKPSDLADVVSALKAADAQITDQGKARQVLPPLYPELRT